MHSDGAVHVDMPDYLSQVHPVLHPSFLRRSAKVGTEDESGRRLDGGTDLKDDDHRSTSLTYNKTLRL